jgi:hypothetical protein
MRKFLAKKLNYKYNDYLFFKAIYNYTIFFFYLFIYLFSQIAYHIKILNVIANLSVHIHTVPHTVST